MEEKHTMPEESHRVAGMLQSPTMIINYSTL